MHKWFLLGVLLAFFLIFIPRLLLYGIGSIDDPALALQFLISVLLFLVLPMLMKGSITLRWHRAQRPHTLFTPFYDQR